MRRVPLRPEPGPDRGGERPARSRSLPAWSRPALSLRAHVAAPRSRARMNRRAMSTRPRTGSKRIYYPIWAAGASASALGRSWGGPSAEGATLVHWLVAAGTVVVLVRRHPFDGASCRGAWLGSSREVRAERDPYPRHLDSSFNGSGLTVTSTRFSPSSPLAGRHVARIGAGGVVGIWHVRAPRSGYLR